MERPLPSGTMIESATLRSIKFEFMTGHDIEQFSSATIEDISDLTSAKLGLPNLLAECETCGASTIENCHGHSGCIKLPTVIYNPNFVSEIAQILNQICPGCKSIRHLQMKRSRKSSNRWESTYGQPSCKYCSKHGNPGRWYPKMKFKVTKDKLATKNVAIIVEVNERLPKKFKNIQVAEALAKDYWKFVPCDFQQPELYFTPAMNLSPSQAFYILKQLDEEFIKRSVPRRELLFLSSIPVTSNGHRITERILPQVNGPELAFDQRAKGYKSLLSSKKKIDDLHVHHHPFGGGLSKAVGNLASYCLNSSSLLHSSSTKEQGSKLSGLKWVKDIVLGKRSDHTFSMVVVGDPKLQLSEIGVPKCVADRLVVLETVTSFNKDRLSHSTLHPSYRKTSSFSKRPSQDCITTPQKGDVLYRSLQDGDLVLMNRPPSVHQHSIISFKVKVIPTKSVISVNPLCCAPFKGDFDGDFLLGYIPQSIQSKTELALLVGLEQQLFDGQNGKSLLSLSHDSLTAAYLLMSPDVFLDKFQMQQLQMLCPRQITDPAIVGSTSSKKHFWTGQQLFSSLIPSSFDFESTSEDLQIRKGEILLIPRDSYWLQNTKTGVFFSLFKFYGKKALDYLFAAQDVLSEWISCRGFSVTLNDLYLCSDTYSRNKLMDEVECGLLDAEDAFHLKSITIDTEIGHLVCMGHKRECRRYYNQKCQFIDKHTAAKMQLYHGLQSSGDTHDVKSFMIDPEIGHILNNCDWYNDLSALSHLNKCNCYKDLARAYLQRDWWRSSKMKNAFIKQHNAAVVAFKEVIQDIQPIIHRFAGKDNSLLQMIHAGSKGSFSKLIQQSVCVGLQHVSNFSFFQMSSKFEFTTWNHQKFSDHLGAISVAAELGSNNPCTIVRRSFLDGLDPTECLLHATSARTNSFSENAELPGTLNRNLMFMMRDLYLAYDGTVRNCYGQQIVEFTYDISGDQYTGSPQSEKPSKFCSEESSNELCGSSVGALASCSISEAAYGGLEQPSSGFESSPLVNLKKLLSSFRKHTPLKRITSLALSSKLKRWNYGFEYAALQVKHHLERVLLADVVDSVLIVYGGKEVEDSLSPWLIHLHLNKNAMSKKRVTTLKIINTLENLSPVLDQQDGIDRTYKLHVLNWKCHLLGSSGEDSSMFCLMVAVQTWLPTRGFDEVRDFIPVLLNSVIGGFRDYPKVDILWNEQTNFPRFPYGCSSKLFLKVTIFNNWKTQRCWADLQDACLPVMELIDWEHSVPDSVCDFSASHGIGSVWNYFLGNLKNVFSDLGRNIHERHLHLVADCFTSTGQIHGLTSKGIKSQRNQSGIKSPFVEACFVKPASVIINAAKEETEDKLLGTVDALAWGKEVPIGTGALFDIMCPKMVCPLDKPENICEAFDSKPVCATDDKLSKTASSFGKWKKSLKSSKFPSSLAKDASSDGKQRKKEEPLNNPKSGPKMILDMRDRLRKILNSNPIGSSLAEEEASYIKEALTFHPRSKEKIGCGIKEIKVEHHPNYEETRCFILVREDGTTEDFSYIKCVLGAKQSFS